MRDQDNALVTYKADSAQSRFTVQAFATGLLSGFGHNPTIAIRDFSAVIRFAPVTFAEPSIELEISAESLEVIDDVKEKDKREIEEMMRKEVLEISSYPEIIFQSTCIEVTRIKEGRYKARIIGDLSMHGATRKGLWIQTQVTAEENKLRAKGDFTLKQSDFKIKPVSVAAGALKLKDELKFIFDILAHRQD